MILIAVQQGKNVYVYSDKKTSNSYEGELHNYTSQTVAINRNDTIYIYDQNGKEIGKYPNDFIDLSNIVGEFI